MHRVLRPGGWAILMLPYLAMSQDDDRMRFSPLALSEALREHFPRGTMGSWGNVDAGCVYLRDNKWSRVTRVEWAAGQRLGECSMRCTDSRETSAPVLEVPCANDRQHAIHLWAVVRKEGTPKGAESRLPLVSDYTTLSQSERDACTRASAELKGRGTVAVLGVRDGSLLDELKRTGIAAVGVDTDVGRVNHARMRGLRALLACETSEKEVGRAVADCRVAICVGPGLAVMPGYVKRHLNRNRTVTMLTVREGERC